MHPNNLWVPCSNVTPVVAQKVTMDAGPQIASAGAVLPTAKVPWLVVQVFQEPNFILRHINEGPDFIFPRELSTFNLM